MSSSTLKKSTGRAQERSAGPGVQTLPIANPPDSDLFLVYLFGFRAIRGSAQGFLLAGLSATLPLVSAPGILTQPHFIPVLISLYPGLQSNISMHISRTYNYRELNVAFLFILWRGEESGF